MATIGFLNIHDFIEELERHILGAAPIRVQHYHRAVGDKNLPITYYTFMVVASAEVDGNTLVCRFVIGKISVMANIDQEKLTRLDRRTRQAAQILRRRLAEAGFRVGAGLISAADESQTQADPRGLWTYEELDNEPEEPAAA